MNTEAGTPAHNNAYDTKIIETYYGLLLSAELYKSKPREDLSKRGIYLMKPNLPFGVHIFDDANETVGSFRRFPTLVAAQDYCRVVVMMK